ncbi:TonB-dependent receptor plug domain-containing protein, partial [Terriglobus albidus]|uniref:TonB-dependent receptor plug domain-containing protein n=1 Tax=Terriglobus albidus TaxID=1592106 RepID=UPI0021DF5F2A
MTTYKLKIRAVAVLVVMLPFSVVGQTSKHKTPSPVEIAKNAIPLRLTGERASLAMKTKAAAIAATASSSTSVSTAAGASSGTKAAPAAAVIPTAIASITVEGHSADEILQTDTAITLQATSAEMQAAPGTYNDIPRFLMTEPGVTFDTDSRNTYMVNGGNPIENLYVVDGVEIANINHLSTSNSSGGFVSMLDTDAVSSVSLHKALYSTKYSGALSSVLSVNTAAPAAQKRHLQMDMGYAGMGAIFSHPLGKKAAFLTQYRRSVINYFTDDIGIGGAPVYSGTLARVDTHPTGKDTVFGLYIGGNDKIALHPNLLDNQDPGYVSTTYTGNRGIYAATWNHIVSGNTLL